MHNFLQNKHLALTFAKIFNPLNNSLLNSQKKNLVHKFEVKTQT